MKSCDANFQPGKMAPSFGHIVKEKKGESFSAVSFVSFISTHTSPDLFRSGKVYDGRTLVIRQLRIAFRRRHKSPDCILWKRSASLIDCTEELKPNHFNSSSFNNYCSHSTSDLSQWTVRKEHCSISANDNSERDDLIGKAFNFPKYA
ncbi:hypothetical protein NPIL_70051 [Nephila pilipes]|uniref:Uncharacterized protein n=1 Tax=Nephila pilipes TaxID=299642 RepID=A0A8X6QRW0_NEPPI|nr:hypothetical protein NPIL_70051 [Nephila pilipes]